MGIEEVREEDISFPEHISGPPRGWRSAVRRVAMLRAMTDGQSGLPPRGSGRQVLMGSVGICCRLLRARLMPWLLGPLGH
jgi:hypothetical protein